MDVTERKQAEEALRENEELLRKVNETVGEGIVLKDASDSFVHWDKTASDIFGLDVEHARGQTPAVFDIKFIYEDGTEYAGDDFPSQYTLRTGESCNNAIMGIKRNNHSITWLKINTRPIFKSGDTKPYLVVISFSDITEQKEKEKQLRDSEQRFQKMLSIIPDMISIHDPDMNIVYSNWNGFANIPEDKRVLNTKCYKTYRDYDHICPDCRAITVLSTKTAFQAEAKLSGGKWIDINIV